MMLAKRQKNNNRRKKSQPNVAVVITILLAAGLTLMSSLSSSSRTPCSSRTSRRCRRGSVPFFFVEAAAADADDDDDDDGMGENENGLFVGEYIEETGFYQSIRMSSGGLLERKQSEYQLIEVYEQGAPNDYYGRVLVLDGVVQLTQRDANSYNEMMSHVPMFQHGSSSSSSSELLLPRRILIIGGGDGYVVTEVLKHPSVESVDFVELDNDVVEICKRHFAPSIEKNMKQSSTTSETSSPHYWWDDRRVHLHISDGAAFVRERSRLRRQDHDNFVPYDVVIQDSSDPWTWDIKQQRRVILPSSVLYTEEHFQNIYDILNDQHGIYAMQSETIQIPSDLEGIRTWRKQALDVGFKSSKYGTIIISSYPTGQIGFLMSEKLPSTTARTTSTTTETDTIRVRERYANMIRGGNITTYYHPKLQTSCFDLPLWAEQSIYGTEGERDRDDDDDVCTI